MRRMRLWLCLVPVVALLVGDLVRGDFEPPPPPDPQRRKGGESLPPLPLPATPLRRTEKKRPPAPPALIGKLQYGKPVWKTTEDGRRFSFLDWASDTTDAYYLVESANSKLGVKYRHIELPLKDFSFSPEEIPILYITGHEDFKFTDEEVQKMRWYLRDGGMLIGDACCGAANLSLAFKREVGRVFPDRPLKRLAMDHPLFHSFYDITEVTYLRQGAGQVRKEPDIFGIELGCRLAVVLFPDDVSCGWARHTHPQGSRIAIDDANQLGLNLMAYALSSYQYGRLWGTQKVYYEQGEKTREEFVVGQVVHGGDWDPAPSAIMNLLKYLGQNSTVDVQFKRADIDLRKLDVFKYPIIFMTGHDDFELLEPEVAALRSYLRNGGVLFADACCGREAFDKAFRRELKKVFPDKELQKLPLEHPIYSAAAKITTVEYTDILKQHRPDFNQPCLEAISIGGVACVIYSKYALASGWQGFSSPFSKGYSQADALRIGLNVVIYSMTH